MVKIFHIASEKEIKDGKVTDVYFERTLEVLKKKSLDKPVIAEVRVNRLPEPYEWAVLAGVEEVASLMEGKPLEVDCLEEGTIFHAGEPVLRVVGNYRHFAVFETPLLGVLCQASGIATKAARCKKKAEGKPVISFGARRMHPAITPMIERSAFVGGCDGVAAVKSAEVINEEPVGTMPHALILLAGDTVKAVKYFHEVISPKVKRVALVDTLGDEKFEALRVAEALGRDLFAVRLDIPSSRRGDLHVILEEVRWELNLRGFDYVKLFVSGGIDEYEISDLVKTADAFGVGTAISNAKVIDFAFDIVEIEGVPVAKRGKKSGSKQLWRCTSCLHSKVIPWQSNSSLKCSCGGTGKRLLTLLVEAGRVSRELPDPHRIREYVLSQLAQLP